MLILTGIWVWASFIEPAQAGNIHITETLSQAICKLSKSFAETSSMQPPLKNKNDHGELAGNPASCTHYRWCKNGCQGFSSVPCSSIKSGNGGGGDDDDDGGGIAVRRMDKKVAGQRMLNGKPQAERDYPFVVNIRWEPIERGRRRAKCAGTILNERWVLTTAQCAIIPMRRRTGSPSHSPGVVSFGEENYDNPELGLDCSRENAFEKAEKYYVESVEVPSMAYINTTIGLVGNPSFDIGLLKIHKKMGTMGVKLGQEPQHCKVDNSTLPGFEAIVGWGQNTRKGLRDPFNKAKVFVKPELSAFEITTLTDDACAKALKDFSTFDPTYRYCGKASSEAPKDANACSSDCGGPLMVVNYSDQHQAPVPAPTSYQCAILSRPACEKGKVSKRPEVLTKVMPHLKWIKETVGNIR